MKLPLWALVLPTKVMQVVAYVTLLFFVGCTTGLVPLVSFAKFSPPHSAADALPAGKALIYGRFATRPDFAFGNQVAIRIREERSKRTYLIRCRDKESVYAVIVEPGRYRVAGFVATYMERRTVGQRKLPASDVFEVRPNAATYIGDAEALAKLEGGGQAWGIRSISNNFTITTAEWKRANTNLSSMTCFSVFEKGPQLAER